MNIVIIGAKGMLGSMLATVFSDMQPTLLDKEEIDITNAQSVRDVLMPLQPDVIINAAAYTNVDGAEEHKEDAFLVNETGVKIWGILRICSVQRSCILVRIMYSPVRRQKDIVKQILQGRR